MIEVLPDTTLRGVRIYEFDGESRLRSISFAQRGRYQSGRRWLLQDVVQTEFEDMRTSVHEFAELEWQSVLDPDLITVLLVKPEQMSAWNLYSYAQHLEENRQKTLRYEIALWTKFVYPLAVLVMMVLALPFAHFQRRQAGVGAKIFAGIMLGLVFHFLNRLFSHLGLLNDWPPFATAILPTAIFLSVAIAMMWWQESDRSIRACRRAGRAGTGLRGRRAPTETPRPQPRTPRARRRSGAARGCRPSGVPARVTTRRRQVFIGSVWPPRRHCQHEIDRRSQR